MISTIIEMLLPDNKNKKYIKTVIGIYIIFTIISPIFTKLNRKAIDVDKIFDEYKIPETVADTIDNTQYIEMAYKEKLRDDIILKLKNLGYSTKEINIDINTNKEKYGEIEKIYLSIEKERKSEIKQIEKININTSEQKAKKTQINIGEKDEIINFLTINYGINKANIIIKET